MPWYVPYNRLDSDQREFVDDDISEKILLKGYAGTGKSVVLVHKLIKIYQDNPNAKCCVISFTHSLLEMFQLGFEESGKLKDRYSGEINKCLGKEGKIDLVTKYAFRDNLNVNFPVQYDFIMVDEVQDMCTSDLLNLKKSKTKWIILGGDENQSIYENDPIDKEPTIASHSINRIIQTSDKSLFTLYRLTPSILKVAKIIIPELEEKLSENRFGHDRDADVVIASAYDEIDEAKYVFENALNYAEDIELTAILFPQHSWIRDFFRYILKLNDVTITEDIEKYLTTRKYEALNEVFHNNEIRLEYVGNNIGSFRHAKKHHNVVVMTWHSAKGMDFDNVFLPFLSSSRLDKSFGYFLPKPLMVATTRCNLNLTLSYSGESMNWVNDILDKNGGVPVDIDSNDDIDFFDF